MIVTLRKLKRSSGTHGPAHDPYAWDRLTVQVNHRTYALMFSALSDKPKLTIDGSTVKFPEGSLMRPEFTDPEKLFERLTGLTPSQFEIAYERMHPYFPDPMGCLADYA